MLKTSIALLGAMAATPVAAATLLLAAQGPGSADKLACAFDPEEGVIFHAPEATPEFEVGDTPELQGESFTYDGSRYLKRSFKQEMAPFELEAFDLIGSVPLFISPGDYDAEVIYVMTSSTGCVFQPYDRE